MTVQELFEAEKIDLDLIEERSGDSSYWSSVFDFVSDEWTTKIESLTEKQASWINKIHEDMIEYRIKNQ